MVDVKEEDRFTFVKDLMRAFFSPFNVQRTLLECKRDVSKISEKCAGLIVKIKRSATIHLLKCKLETRDTIDKCNNLDHDI
ncbi:chaperone protein HtpG [Acrasis kona]|uniref:Chaperone protein HtpG n=1 Tax=Acrasis kona TaxID=1008807 RepID=A0AAW2YWY0_9EUKA